jgi:putative sigma-54 modulation protein
LYLGKLWSSIKVPLLKKGVHMKKTITFRHMEATDAIKDHVEEQLTHLEKFLIKPTEVHVILSVEKFRQKAEITVHEQNFDAQAFEVSDDLYASIDKAILKIQAQIKKHKDKVQEHHKHHVSVQEASAQAEADFFTRSNSSNS